MPDSGFPRNIFAGFLSRGNRSKPGSTTQKRDEGLKNSVCIIKDRFYWRAVQSEPGYAQRCVVPEDTKSTHYFCIDDKFIYWNFFLDFGPLHLGHLYRFCEMVNEKLEDPRLSSKQIVFVCGSHPHRRANSACLAAAYAVLYLRKSPKEAWDLFKDVYPPFPPFHDASPCVCTYKLTILDVLEGIARANKLDFFDFRTFDADEYEYFERPECGDLNWIVKNKFLAFAGPNDHSMDYCSLSPSDYIPHFRRWGVKLVIRLNKKYYDEKKFTRAGFDHLDLYYLDGSNPPEHILQRFIETCENAKGAIAVHCKAGLGRTGTCIGAYLMKHYRLTAAQVIGWMRVCRPGSVIGPQQHFLEELQPRMWKEGDEYRRRHGIPNVDDLSTTCSKLTIGRRADSDNEIGRQRSLGSPTSSSDPEPNGMLKEEQASSGAGAGVSTSWSGHHRGSAYTYGSPLAEGSSTPTSDTSQGDVLRGAKSRTPAKKSATTGMFTSSISSSPLSSKRSNVY